MTDTSLPVLGAALPISGLAEYRDWLLADQRDVEIQDPCLPDALDQDWTALTRQARDLLDGHTGWRGIHGPFDGIALLSKDRKVRALASELQIELAHLTLDPVLKQAQEIGCMLVFEGIEDQHPGPLLALVRSFESDLVRMSLDIGHAMITNRRGGPPPDQWVREAGPLLGHLHLQDSDGNIDRHWAPGKG